MVRRAFRRSIDVCGIRGAMPHLSKTFFTQKPRVGHEASGAGSLGAFSARVSDSTAPIAVKCQSFLDNFIAQFGAVLPRAASATTTTAMAKNMKASGNQRSAHAVNLDRPATEPRS